MSDPIEIDVHGVQTKLAAQDDFLLLDCREADEHAHVNIPQAILIPMSEIQERLGEIEPYRDREIIVHCHHGGRSMRVVLWLRQQGFARARNMTGGIDEWSIQIDPSLARY